MVTSRDHQTIKFAVQLAIFCVLKKEIQGLRCVLDYRSVNSSSFSDRYALRTIDDCLETVGRAGSKVYSALDCSSAFWQLQLRPSDRPFTAFTVPGKGMYHWRTCPQGLMGALASFSRLMDVLLADAENMLTYIDDVLVHSWTHEEHLKDLSAAIDKIGAANLRRRGPVKNSSARTAGHSRAAAAHSWVPPPPLPVMRACLLLLLKRARFLPGLAWWASLLSQLPGQVLSWRGWVRVGRRWCGRCGWSGCGPVYAEL
jgi:hypothetical protein